MKAPFAGCRVQLPRGRRVPRREPDLTDQTCAVEPGRRTRPGATPDEARSPGGPTSPVDGRRGRSGSRSAAELLSEYIEFITQLDELYAEVAQRKDAADDLSAELMTVD